MRQMRKRAPLLALMLFLLGAVATAEVIEVEILRRDDAGTHERVIARVHFAVNPEAEANRGIVDLDLAPRNTDALVEFSSDLLIFLPKDAAAARGTVFLEIVNRGRDQSLGLMSDAAQTDLAPENWNLGDRFLLEQGFTVAFLGWQFNVASSQGLTFQAPIAAVRGTVRADYVDSGTGRRYTGFSTLYCARDPLQPDAMLTYRTRLDGPANAVPRERWQFSDDGCAVILPADYEPGLYEAVYETEGSPVAGLGMAAARDFASYLKFGAADAPLREEPAHTRRIMGFGYSQSARFLRAFVRDGFNADEQGRVAFDGLLIASAGAGGGSFNHRFAMPGQAGNSVLSILRPVDLPPFNDEGLLARARTAQVAPRIFTTVTSTEYWARAASLTHTTEDGTKDTPLDPSARLYFLTGTPHAAGPLPPIQQTNQGRFRHAINFAKQKWVLRALTLALDAWITDGTEPPPSRYPTLARQELVPLDQLQFPTVSSLLTLVEYLPPVWRMDFGPDFPTTGVITKNRPTLGEEYSVLVPQVDEDGNERGGIALTEVAVPLGTYTGWNVTEPPLTGMRYLAGLLGSFVPFAETADERLAVADPRLSIAERYTTRQAYLGQVQAAAESLVEQRFLLPNDVPPLLQHSEAIWDAIVKR
jgi:hypothetical protein